MQAWNFTNSQCRVPQECKNVKVAIPIEIKSPLIPAVHPIAAHQAAVLSSCKTLMWRVWLRKTCVTAVSRPLSLRGSASCVVFSRPLQPPVLMKWLQQQQLLDGLPNQCLNMRGVKSETNNTKSNIAVFRIMTSTSLPSGSFQLAGC